MTQAQFGALLAAVTNCVALIAATVIALHNDAAYTSVVLDTLIAVIGGSAVVTATGHISATALALRLVKANAPPGPAAMETLP